MIAATSGRRRQRMVDGRAVVWEDTFDRATLGEDWGVLLRGNVPTNSEEQAYVNDPRTVRLEGGVLIIEAHREAYDAGSTWISGRVDTNSRHAFTRGRIEARIQMPTGQGLWPAFWTEGWTLGAPREAGANTGSGWPDCGEIDILEALNAEAFTHAAVHVTGADKGAASPSGLDRTQWHVYAVEKSANTLAFSIDGAVFWTLDISAATYDTLRHPHFLILNLAVGGSWPGASNETTPEPATMLVDWVRVLAPAGEMATPPAGIALPATTSATVGGGKVVLTPTITPSRAHDQAVYWTTSHPSVASVGGGYVMPVSAGTATITATLWNGVSASSIVTVT